MADDPQNTGLNSHQSALDDGEENQPDHSFGRYRIERSLGSGAMATVMLATDTNLGRKVALKVPLIKSGSNDQMIQKRLMREAKAIAALSHPNICPIHDVGVVDNTFYISMAYIEGISLIQAIEETDEFEEKEVAQIIRSIADAVSEAHRQGILHRDLKPGNIMIDRRGEPVVLDFGLARFYQQQDDSVLSLDGHALGTPSYMSPEQTISAKELTPATDIYSLGVIMWEMLTGKRLYTGDALSIMGQILHNEPPNPSLIRTDLSSGMESICIKAMAKKKEDRYQTMDEFVQAIEALLQGSGVNILGGSGSGILIESGVGIPIVDLSADQTRPELDQTRHEFEVVARVREQRWILLVGLLLGVIILLLWMMRGQLMPPERTQPQANPTEMNPSNVSSPEEHPSRPGDLAHRGPPPEGMSVSEIFKGWDRDGDGKISAPEFAPHIVERADFDRDGFVTQEEYSQALYQIGYRPLVAPPNR